MSIETSFDLDFTLKSLTLENFMAYKSLDLDFEGKDIVGILAQYAKDKNRSNRSGKTVILEAIRYIITGKHRAKTDKQLIHNGEKHMIATGVFTDGQKEYVIRRGCDAKGKGLLEIDWVTNISEAQEEINNLFGITPEDIDLTNFFKQADIMGFMGMKPAEKTAFLMNYIENQHWSEKERLANADRAVVKQKIRDNDNLKATLESGLEVDIGLEGMRDDQVEILKQKEVELSELKNKSAEITGKLRNLAENKKQITSSIQKTESEISLLEDELSEAEEQEQSYQQAKNNLSIILKRIKAADIKKTLAEVEKEKSQISNKIDLLKNKINSANNNVGICPIIKKECDSIKFTTEEVNKMKNTILEHRDQLSELEKLASKIDENTEDTAKAERLKVKINTLDKTKKNIDGIKQKIKSKSDDLLKLKQDFRSLDIGELNEKQEYLEDKVVKLEFEIVEINKKINKFESRIQSAKSAKEKIDRLVADNEKLKAELSLLNYTCFMFSKKGIPSGEIENAFGEIEEKINYCLENLNAGISISFSADTETTEKEPVCQCGFEFPKGFKGKDCLECGTPRQFKRREEINFSVIEGTKEQSFDLDSGGGKQIICYAVKIALTYFKRRMSKCRLNMLFLDEIDSALDPYLANQIISSVTNFLTKKLGFKQIIMVSHKEQIKNSMPHIIKVTRFDNHSTARFI